MLPAAARRAFEAVSSRALSLTSTAHTVAVGRSSARVIAMGPVPQPTSQNTPLAGGSGAVWSNNEVPASRWP